MVLGIDGQRSHVYPVSELTQSRQRGSFTGRQPHKNPPPHPKDSNCHVSRRCDLMRLSINRLSSDPCDLIGFSSAEVDGRESLCSSPRREILVCATMAPLWTRHRDPGKGKWGEGSSLCGNLQSAPTSSLPPHVDFMGRCTQECLEMGYMGF